jgi:hypothetical protein
VVHGDEDGSVRFVPLLVSTPSLQRPRLLFEMKVLARSHFTTPRHHSRTINIRHDDLHQESVENIAVSGLDMFLVTGYRRP